MSVQKQQLRRFQNLMQQRVRHILLVSSLYDSFILTEDGHLNDAILRQFIDLNLSQNPDLIRVSTGAEALKIAREHKRFDLIISSMNVGDMNALELASKLAVDGLTIPVILLAYDNRELTDFIAKNDVSLLHRIFLWQGDVRILLAMVKHIEDCMNVAHDTGELGVPAIIVVEDNIRFYSSFLPMLYSELVEQTRSLISEGLNLSQKIFRTRARPKILLCECFEEAWEYFTTYREQTLAIISDIEFSRDGKLDRRAGIDLIAQVREQRPDVPVVLQSSFPENEELARSLGALFLLKGSPTLLQELRRILFEHFGFGDFVFCMPDGKEVARAQDLKMLIDQLKTVPAESIGYHGERNHFSMWLKARTEFALADELRPRKVAEFESLEHLRQDLIQSLGRYRRARDKVVVADFDRQHYDPSINIYRIGGGSLGGKARGLAFANRLLNESELAERFPGVQISVPDSVVLGTDVFDLFLEQNDLRDFAIGAYSDREIEARFLAAPFPDDTLRDLEVFLDRVRYPLAVRSSGLLEDSPNQAFAGVYETFMLPNAAPDTQARLIQLITAVKRVFASTFSQRAKAYLAMTPYRLEAERMAVIIQRVVGSAHGTRYYPDFAGVGRSHNFYPTPRLKAEDGIAAVALGLGRTVVDGANCFRFCPKYPRQQLASSSSDDLLRASQREFYALDLDHESPHHGAEGAELARYGLRVAEQDGTLAAIGSTYSPDNDVVTDGISRAGVRLVTFAPILKHELFPLAEVLDELLGLGAQGTSAPVEIEFAVNLAVSPGEPAEFGFLQLRPLALASEAEELQIGHVLSSALLCRSGKVLGNGKIANLRDLVVVDMHRFDRARSREVAQQVARFNAELQGRGLPYLLVGVGRWGSNDPYLGIPVTWNEISGARVIVEAGFKDFKVAPSQGTHFFQNLTSCNVGYFTVNPEAGEGFVDWEWLTAQPAEGETEFVRHLRVEAPLLVKMSGRTGEGVILKPGASGESE